LAGHRRITAAANSDLRREEAKRGPGGRVEERGNHCGFPVRHAQAKITMAKVLAEVQRRRRNSEAMARGKQLHGWVSARAGGARK
jgi:hypothetical protein